MAVAIVTIEGVLAEESTTGHLLEWNTIPEGFSLARGLATVHSLVYVTSLRSERQVRNWLSVRQPPTPATVLGPWNDPMSLDAPLDRVRRMEEVRAGGTFIAQMVDADPLVVSEVLRRGVSALLMVRPRTTSWHTDSVAEEPAGWDELLAEIAAQENLAGGGGAEPDDDDDAWMKGRYE